MSIYLIRHTPVAVEKGLCYGQLDVPLADTFSSDAANVLSAINALSQNSLLKVISSPSIRCQQLAALISHNFTTDQRLMELNFGRWEGRTWSELDSRESRYWGDHWQTEKPPNGESLQDLVKRIAAFLTDVSDDVIIVAHAGPIRVFHHLLLKESIEQSFQRPIGFGQIFKLEI